MCVLDLGSYTGFLMVACHFFFNDTATTEIYTVPYTLSLHDALPISHQRCGDAVALERRHHLADVRSEEHTSELQSHGTISYAVFCLKKKKNVRNKIKRYIFFININTKKKKKKK